MSSGVYNRRIGLEERVVNSFRRSGAFLSVWPKGPFSHSCFASLIEGLDFLGIDFSIMFFPGGIRTRNYEGPTFPVKSKDQHPDPVHWHPCVSTASSATLVSFQTHVTDAPLEQAAVSLPLRRESAKD